MCVGPFMFANRVVGDSVTVVKSPYYYDRKDVHLDKIVFKSEPDAAAAIAALKAGDLQALDSIPPTDVPTVEHTRSLHVLQNEVARLRVGLRSTSGTRTASANSVRAGQHAAGFEPGATARVRGGDRPQHPEQGRVRRRRAAGLHAVRADEPGVRPEHPLHTVQSGGREEARRRLGDRRAQRFTS